MGWAAIAASSNKNNNNIVNGSLNKSWGGGR